MQTEKEEESLQEHFPEYLPHSPGQTPLADTRAAPPREATGNREGMPEAATPPRTLGALHCQHCRALRPTWERTAVPECLVHPKNTMNSASTGVTQAAGTPASVEEGADLLQGALPTLEILEELLQGKPAPPGGAASLAIR